MKNRSIELVAAPPAAHYVGDGFRVHTFIPSSYRLTMERMSPFIMMDYNSKFYFEPSEQARGVDVHPHRGFETVTIAYNGKVAHHDSAGNSGVIAEGDVQWMTAASGILHKEYHEENFSKEGGFFQMVQLWVNLPAKDKMSSPKYQEITNNNIPKLYLNDGKSYISIIAGLHQNIKGIASTFTEVHLMNAYLQKGTKETFSFTKENNTAILVIEGSLLVNDTEHIPSDHLVLFEKDAEKFEIQATEDAIVLILSGTPIDEPIAAHGPFVMNTRHELVSAFEDFQAGKFGVLK